MTTPIGEPRRELQAPPPLGTLAPLCPMCGESVTIDDGGGWTCLTDKANWPGLNVGSEKGEWQEEDILACLSMAKHKPGGVFRRVDTGWEWQCARPLGHDGQHYSSNGTMWPNPWLIQSDPEEAAG